MVNRGNPHSKKDERGDKGASKVDWLSRFAMIKQESLSAFCKREPLGRCEAIALHGKIMGKIQRQDQGDSVTR